MSDTTTHEVSPTRTVNGHVLPAPGAWEIDPGHTDVAFIGRHFMVTKVRGRFTDVTGTVVIAPHLDDSTVEVTINMASVESGSVDRDTHIKSAQLFDVEQFPTITFHSTRITKRGAETYDVIGTLTMHGVSKDLVLPVAHMGKAKDPWGGDRLGFEAETTLNRKDFGLNWNAMLEAGGFLVGDEVKVSIEIQAVGQ